MTLYKAINSSFRPEIQTVIAQRISDSSVWIDGRRAKIKTDYESYFATREQARDHLIAEAGKRVEVAQGSLEYARRSFSTAQAL